MRLRGFAVHLGSTSYCTYGILNQQFGGVSSVMRYATISDPVSFSLMHALMCFRDTKIVSHGHPARVVVPSRDEVV
jgi:hypothetical protein